MKLVNKKAKFNYVLLEKFECGIVLSGVEAKALREGRADLSNSYAKIVGGEAYLLNANIPSKALKNYQPTRSRKLLLHKNQLVSISSKMKQKKLTLVPVKMYNKGRLVKVEIALAKPKRKFEKREAIKKKDLEREIEREIKNKYQ